MATTVTLRIRESDHQRLKALAAADHRSVTATVTVLVDEEEKRRGGLELGMGSVAEKNEGRRVAMVEGQRFEVGDVPVLTIPAPRIGRAPETVCARCRVPWKNHQEGSRKNRAGTTGCTRFEDPS